MSQDIQQLAVSVLTPLTYIGDAEDIDEASRLLAIAFEGWLDSQVQPDLFQTISGALELACGRYGDGTEKLCLHSADPRFKPVVAMLAHAVMQYENRRDPDAHRQPSEEISLRDRFAMAALTCVGGDVNVNSMAGHCYRAADAMMAERSRQAEGG